MQELGDVPLTGAARTIAELAYDYLENVLVTHARPETSWPLPDMLTPQHQNGHLACDPDRLQVIWPAAHFSHPGGGADRSQPHTTGVEPIIGLPPPKPE